MVDLSRHSTAGLEVECDLGFYNPTVNANNQTACFKCPERSTTLAKASTRPDECVCEEGYYDAGTVYGAGVRCQLCVSGTKCSTSATTLATLPVRRGFYRRSNATTDIMRCPDAAVNCGAEPFCPESTSGCRGTATNSSAEAAAAPARRRLAASTDPYGAEPDELGCAPGLTGIFCRSCARNGTGDDGDGARESLRYYVKATPTEVATCKPCGNTLVTLVAMGAAFIAAAAAGLGLVAAVHRFLVPPLRKQQLRGFSREINLPVKLKILLSYYQVVTVVDSVYAVELPSGVKQMLNSFSVVVGLGVKGVSTPLECMGLSGYLNELRFFMLVPPRATHSARLPVHSALRAPLKPPHCVRYRCRRCSSRSSWLAPPCVSSSRSNC